MARQTIRRVQVNQSGTALSGANIIGKNANFMTTLGADIRTPYVTLTGLQGYAPTAATAEIFLQLFENALTLPADNVKPTVSIPIVVASSKAFTRDLGTRPIRLQTPISWCVSTTETKKTLDATGGGLCEFLAGYRGDRPVAGWLHDYREFEHASGFVGGLD
jgi:hypothetical protein